MKIALIALLLLVFIDSVQASDSPSLTEHQLAEVLNHMERPLLDKKRDANRLPTKVLAFSRVTTGDHVLDLYAGGGWYSELFSRIVGPKGIVYAQNDTLTWRFGGKEILERTKDKRLTNVVRLDKVAIADIKIPDDSLDIAFMGINYHDLFFTHRTRNGKMEVLREDIVDYRASFAAVKKAMKKDGVLIIIDHFAKPGSGYTAANKLHRIDPNIVKHQLTDSGFVLLEEAFYLRNSNDDLTTSVFEPIIRGKTDRFIYKFGKKNN